jgi:hypothetical protein
MQKDGERSVCREAAHVGHPAALNPYVSRSAVAVLEGWASEHDPAAQPDHRLVRR